MRASWPLVAVAVMLGMPADAKELRLRRPPRGFQMRMAPFVVAPGADREGCEYRVTPNAEPMDVKGFDLKVTRGTHHFVLWEYLGADRDPAHFWSGIAYAPGCIGLGPRDAIVSNANLFGMLSGHVRVRFPPGVAVRLEPHAILYANLHFHNYSAADIATDAVFNLLPARKGSVRHHAQAITVGSAAIDIPPRGTASLTGEWHAPVDLNLVQLSTHQHHRGTRMAINRVDAAGNDMGEEVESLSWEHPTVRWYRRALRVPAGEGFRFVCEWRNDDDHPVHFGVTTEDEMCFLTGYFYPDDESVPVTGPGCVPQGAGLECFVPKSP